LKIAEKRHVQPAHRQMQALGEICPPRVVKRARSWSERNHCRSKQLRARLATRGERISPSACICRWAGWHASFQQFSKINISL